MSMKLHFYPGIGLNRKVFVMLQEFMDTKIIKNIYSVLFPFIVIVLLLGIASFNNRPLFLGSITFDLILRLLITVWYCVFYIKLSRISSFSYFPNKKWSKSDIGELEKYYYIGMGIFMSVGCGLITWWVIQGFFPNFSSFAFLIAAINSMIFFLPLITHYWVLKI
jgi:hypothetical protein